MKKIIVLLLLSFQMGFAQEGITKYYFIRHAEKVDASENPNLSTDGQKRALKWKEILSDISFDAVYSTNYNRTLQTAKPIAEARKLEIIMYDPKKIDLTNFKKNTINKTTLVVGHSNSTPEFVNKILGQIKYEKIAETTFGNLYLVTVFKKNNFTSALLKLE